MPPGSFGLPFVGENAALLKNGNNFFGKRIAKYNSNIIRSHIFGERVIVMAGAEEAKLFYDMNRMTRCNAFAPHLVKYFFGNATATGIDPPEHTERKKLIMTGFTEPKLRQYLDIWAGLVDKYCVEWARQGRVVMKEQLPMLHTEFALAYVLGLNNLPKAELQKRTKQIMDQINSLGPYVLFELPGTKLRRAGKGRRDLTRWLMGMVREVRQQSTSGATVDTDALILNAMALARDPFTGELMNEELVAAELMNVIRPPVTGAYLSLYMLHAWAEHPEVLQNVRQEVEGLLDTGSSEIGMHNFHRSKDFLDRMQYGDMMIKEVRRFYPFTPLLSARVREPFVYRGYFFPKGWPVILAVHATHRDPLVYTDPERFDPMRFGEERQEHKNADERFVIVQQGGSEPNTNHRCAGEVMTTLMLKSLAAKMAVLYSWELPAQNLRIPMHKIPTMPKSGVILSTFQDRHTYSLINTDQASQSATAGTSHPMAEWSQLKDSTGQPAAKKQAADMPASSSAAPPQAMSAV